MKNILFVLSTFVFLFFSSTSHTLVADDIQSSNNFYAYADDNEEELDEEELDPLRFYKPRYDATFKASMETIQEAIIKSIEDINCVVIQNVLKTNEEGELKLILKSDYCVFTEGSDSTFDILERYSLKMPFIRGGAWKNGRMQYKFIVKEQSDNTNYLILKGQLSGFENYVSNRVHFWVSNGIFEHDMLRAIERHIRALEEE